MRKIALVLIAACWTGLVAAQSLSGPVEGFVFDGPTQSIRAVNGLPGSATFGPALVSRVEFGSVAPHQNYAVAFKSNHGIFVSGLGGSHISTAPISGIFGLPEDAAWSGDGSVVILFSRSGNWMQAVSGAPKAPHANPHLALAVLPGTLSAIASDATGKQSAIAMGGPEGGVYLNTPSQQFVPVGKAQNPVALTFSEDGETLYVLDGKPLRVTSTHLPDWTTHTVWLVGLHDPFALRAGHDASNQPCIYVASRSDRMVAVYSPANHKMTARIHLGVAPTGLDELGRNSFVLASRSKPTDPLWLFTTVPQASVFFVPAPATAGKGAD